jgi:hypothetical protein
VCGTPVFHLDMPPPDGPSMLEISDPTTMLGCNLLDLKVHQVMPVPPESGTWELRSGDTVTAQWSPGGELGLDDVVTADLRHLNAANQIDDFTAIFGVTSDGDLVHFTVPSVSPGSYVLELKTSPARSCGPQVMVTLTYSTHTQVSMPSAR